MAEQNALVERLKARRGQAGSLLAPWLRALAANSSAGLPVFSPGLRQRQAARQMRILDAGKFGISHPGAASRLSQNLTQKFSGVRELVHLKAQPGRQGSLWSRLDIVLPNQQAAAPEEPSQPGVLRQGSVIPRMTSGSSPFPRPGQSTEDFKRQVEAGRPAAAPERPAQKPALPQRARLYSRVQEITSRPVSGQSREAEEPSAGPESEPQTPSLSTPPLQPADRLPPQLEAPEAEPPAGQPSEEAAAAVQTPAAPPAQTAPRPEETAPSAEFVPSPTAAFEPPPGAEEQPAPDTTPLPAPAAAEGEVSAQPPRLAPGVEASPPPILSAKAQPRSAQVPAARPALPLAVRSAARGMTPRARAVSATVQRQPEEPPAAQPTPKARPALRKAETRPVQPDLPEAAPTPAAGLPSLPALQPSPIIHRQPEEQAPEAAIARPIEMQRAVEVPPAAQPSAPAVPPEAGAPPGEPLLSPGAVPVLPPAQLAATTPEQEISGRSAAAEMPLHTRIQQRKQAAAQVRAVQPDQLQPAPLSPSALVQARAPLISPHKYQREAPARQAEPAQIAPQSPAPPLATGRTAPPTSRSRAAAPALVLPAPARTAPPRPQTSAQDALASLPLELAHPQPTAAPTQPQAAQAEAQPAAIVPSQPAAVQATTVQRQSEGVVQRVESPSSSSPSSAPDMEKMAEEILPIIKRLLELESERS